MALKSRRVSIDFGFGADEFTDRKLVLNSKLIKAENITLNKPKTISKREGYKFSGDETMDGEVIDPPMNIFDYNNNPVIMSANKVYEQIPKGRDFDYFTYPKNWRDSNSFNFAVEPKESAIGSLLPASSDAMEATNNAQPNLAIDCAFLLIPEEGRERRLKCTVYGAESVDDDISLMGPNDFNRKITVVVEDVDNDKVLFKQESIPPSTANCTGYTSIKVVPWGGHVTVGSTPDKFIIIAMAKVSEETTFDTGAGGGTELEVFGTGTYANYSLTPQVWVMGLDSNVGYSLDYQSDFWTWAGITDPLTTDPDILYSPSWLVATMPSRYSIPRLTDHIDFICDEKNSEMWIMYGAQWMYQPWFAGAAFDSQTADTRQKYYLKNIVQGPTPSSFMPGVGEGTIIVEGPREAYGGAPAGTVKSSIEGFSNSPKSFINMAQNTLFNLQIDIDPGLAPAIVTLLSWSVSTRGDFVSAAVNPAPFPVAVPHDSSPLDTVVPLALTKPPAAGAYQLLDIERDQRSIILGYHMSNVGGLMDEHAQLILIQPNSSAAAAASDWEFNRDYIPKSISLVNPKFPSHALFTDQEKYLILYLEEETLETSNEGEAVGPVAANIVGDRDCRTIVYFINDIDWNVLPVLPHSFTSRKDDLMYCKPQAHPSSGGYDEAFQDVNNGSCYRNGPSIDGQGLEEEYRYLLFPVVRKEYRLSDPVDTFGTTFLMAYRVNYDLTGGGAWNDLIVPGHAISKSLDGSSYGSTTDPKSIGRYFICPHNTSDQQGSLQFGAFGFTSLGESYVSSISLDMGFPVQGLQYQDNLFTTGGFLKVYNGTSYMESNYHLQPNVIKVTSPDPKNATFGKTFDPVITPFSRTDDDFGVPNIFYEDPANALFPKYQFAFVFEWTDSNGIIHRSSPSESIIIQGADADNHIGAPIAGSEIVLVAGVNPSIGPIICVAVGTNFVVGDFITNVSRTKTAEILQTYPFGGDICFVLQYTAGSAAFIVTESILSSSGGNNNLTFYVSPYDKSLSEKPGIVLKGYRSLNLSPGALTEAAAGAAGVLLHEKTIDIQNPDILSEEYKGAVPFVFTSTDAQLAQRELIYTAYGVSPNVSPPAVKDISEHDGRLFLLGAGARNKVWYSKPIEHGYSTEFGTNQSIETFSEGGGIIGVSGLSNRLFLFKENSILSAVGTPLDEKDVGSGYSAPIAYSATIGCSDPTSIVETESGTFFQARDDVYYITRNFKLDKIGIEVGLSLQSPLLSAVHIPDKYELRLCDTNGMIIYNTLFKQWTTSDKRSKSNSVQIKGKHHILDADDPSSGYVGGHMVETEDFYNDGADHVSIDVETAWIKMTTPQGYQRVKEIYLLGELHADTNFVLEVFTNYKEYPDEAIPLTASDISEIFTYGGGAAWGSPAYYGGANPDNIYQLRHKPKIQKCEALKIKIKEVATTDTQGFSLNNVMLEVAGKTGGFKLKESKTV
jgi:hypothetical protein